MPDMTPTEIREARQTLGLTQSQLAELMGVRRSGTISSWETENRNPSPQAVRLLRAYLDGYRPADWPTG